LQALQIDQTDFHSKHFVNLVKHFDGILGKNNWPKGVKGTVNHPTGPFAPQIPLAMRGSFLINRVESGECGLEPSAKDVQG
jgi:hypothetical protein